MRDDDLSAAFVTGRRAECVICGAGVDLCPKSVRGRKGNYEGNFL
jgi:hypothetical protein